MGISDDIFGKDNRKSANYKIIFKEKALPASKTKEDRLARRQTVFKYG
jgi:hypothetical protein